MTPLLFMDEEIVYTITQVVDVLYFINTIER